MIAMEVAHQDEVNKMLRKPGQTEAFTASAVRESSVVAKTGRGPNSDSHANQTREASCSVAPLVARRHVAARRTHAVVVLNDRQGRTAANLRGHHAHVLGDSSGHLKLRLRDRAGLVQRGPATRISAGGGHSDARCSQSWVAALAEGARGYKMPAMIRARLLCCST